MKQKQHAELFAFVALEELFFRWVVLSIHVKLTNEIRYLLGTIEAEAMRTDLLLINTSREEGVAEAILIQPLQNKIGEAFLDVFSKKQFPVDNELLKLEKRLFS